MQCKGKLTSTALSGPSYDVFAKVLRGLSGARLTRPGQFRSSDDSAAVRCSYKVDSHRRAWRDDCYALEPMFDLALDRVHWGSRLRAWRLDRYALASTFEPALGGIVSKRCCGLGPIGAEFEHSRVDIWGVAFAVMTM